LAGGEEVGKVGKVETSGAEAQGLLIA